MLPFPFLKSQDPTHQEQIHHASISPHNLVYHSLEQRPGRRSASEAPGGSAQLSFPVWKSGIGVVTEKDFISSHWAEEAIKGPSTSHFLFWLFMLVLGLIKGWIGDWWHGSAIKSTWFRVSEDLGLVYKHLHGHKQSINSSSRVSDALLVSACTAYTRCTNNACRQTPMHIKWK